MKKLVVIGLLMACVGVSDVYAADYNNAGAYLEPPGESSRVRMGWLVPPYAEVTIVDEQGDVYASYIDSGIGSVITELQIPDINSGILAVFYSDGNGLSSRVPVDFSRESIQLLLPPTIYSRKQLGSLGFVGNAYPLSTIILQIDSSTNENKTLQSLADNTGEWQIDTVNLAPGIYQAKAKAIFGNQESAWSQTMNIQILTSLDQAIEDFGKQTRSSVEKAIEVLPGPLQSVAKTLDDRSSLLATYLLPTLLTLSTITQSGILIQNVFYLLYHALVGLLQAIGVVKKRVDSGIVYDAVSKRPLGRAIVRLYDAYTHQLIETDVTTAEGSFSFLPPEGVYYIRASKPGYLYPSRLILGKRDGRYNHVYSGADIRVSGDNPTISVSIPLDPEAFVENWRMKLSRVWQQWFEPANRWLLLFGFFLALLSYSRDSTRLNIVILGMYLLGLVYYVLQDKTFNRGYGVVVDDRGKPLSGIELNLIDTEFNRLVSRRVSDAKGRYQFFVPPGKYQIKLVSPGFSLVKSVKKAYQGDELAVEGERGQSKRLIPRIVVKRV